jgi:hypothetical protein
MKTKLTILTFLLLNILTYSEIRYVSPQGSNTAPFISWATASHTIQGCINVSNPGDTIYVGNGVYKEVVNMIRKLALIGSGIDSCIIDTRELAVLSDFGSIVANDSCSVESFQIIVSNYNDGIFWGAGVRANSPSNSHYSVEIKNNLIYGGYSGTNTSINAVIKNNMMIDNKNGLLADGGLFDLVTVRIENNFILVRENSQLGLHYAISMTPVKKSIPYIIGNTIAVYKDDLLNGGYCNLVSKSNKGIVANNLIYSKYNHRAYEPYAMMLKLDLDSCYNNVIIGDYWGIGYYFTHPQKIKNNVIVNARKGLYPDPYTSEPEAHYNNIFNTPVLSDGFTLDSTNISVDPMFVNEDSLDFRLQMFSPLIDAGDPEILDKDGTRSDIGLLGGPYGSEEYKYIDYPPRPPIILDIVVDSSLARIILKRNTEADFSHYNIYRSSTPNFIIDSLNLIKTTEDTSFTVRINEEKYYYKITGIDKQGKESRGSEEIELTVTGIEENKVVLEDYKLFQNYPNPFNPSTIISYRLKEESRVRLTVYNLNGEQIAVLADGNKEKGYHELEFKGEGLASGIYFYRMEVKDMERRMQYTDMKKMIYLK